MATQALQVTGPSEQFKQLVQVFKRTRHDWMNWSYQTPEDERTDEKDSAYCDAYAKALNALLLEPAENIHDLSMKLRIYNEEEIDDAWALNRPIVALLADDARRISVQF